VKENTPRDVPRAAVRSVVRYFPSPEFTALQAFSIACQP
jgi:hypothetical protein